MPQLKKKINVSLNSIANVNEEGTWMLKKSVEDDIVQRLGDGATSEEGGDYTEFTFRLPAAGGGQGQEVTATVELGGQLEEGEIDEDFPAVYGNTQAAVDRLHEVLMAAHSAQGQNAGRKKRKTKKTRKSKKTKKSTRRR